MKKRKSDHHPWERDLYLLTATDIDELDETETPCRTP
jgi:hypothetical protein